MASNHSWIMRDERIPGRAGQWSQIRSSRGISELGGSKPLYGPLESHAEVKPRCGASGQRGRPIGYQSIRCQWLLESNQPCVRAPARRSCCKVSCTSLGTAAGEGPWERWSRDFGVERLEAERGDDRRS